MKSVDINTVGSDASFIKLYAKSEILVQRKKKEKVSQAVEYRFPKDFNCRSTEFTLKHGTENPCLVFTNHIIYLFIFDAHRLVFLY